MGFELYYSERYLPLQSRLVRKAHQDCISLVTQLGDTFTHFDQSPPIRGLVMTAVHKCIMRRKDLLRFAEDLAKR